MQICVIDGGLLGLEAAGELHKLGTEVAIVHSRKWLMSSQLDLGAGQALNAIMLQQGIQSYLGQRPQKIESREENARTSYTLILPDDTENYDGYHLFSIGITPRDALAVNIGLARVLRGGIEIDSYIL